MSIYVFFRKILDLVNGVFFNFLILIVFISGSVIKSQGYEYNCVISFSLIFISKGITQFVLGGGSVKIISFLLSWIAFYSVLYYILIVIF